MFRFISLLLAFTFQDEFQFSPFPETNEAKHIVKIRFLFFRFESYLNKKKGRPTVK